MLTQFKAKNFRPSGYLEDIYDTIRYKKKVDDTIKVVLDLKKKLKFDVILFRGSSGAAIAYPISYLTGTRVFHIRKDGESDHGTGVEGVGVVKKFIIIDDFISSGTTIQKVFEKFYQYVGPHEKPKCVGIVLYSCNTPPEPYFLKITGLVGPEEITTYSVDHQLKLLTKRKSNASLES